MNRRGFTLVELLVLLAIVVVGLALCAPAVCRLTQDARRNQCRNNLKQLGLAFHNYHDTFRAFPPGWVSRDGAAGSGARLGWQAMILPFVEQAPLFNQIDFRRLPQDDAGKPLKSLQTALSIYRCPADPTPEINPLRDDFGTSNYSGNYGHLPTPRLAPLGMADSWPGAVAAPVRTTGMFWRNSRVGFQDVTDGLSNTLLAGERCVTSGAGIWSGVSDNTHEDDTLTEASHRAQLNAGLYSFSSLHGGGVTILFGDGAVRFISEKIDSKPAPELGVLQALAGRNDGQPLPQLK